MKKLILVALIAAFAATGCTNEGIEEDHELQIIDKDQVHSPIDKKRNKDKDEDEDD